MTNYYLGIDIGGTKTEAALTDGQGSLLAFRRAGPGNPQSIGDDRFLPFLEGLIAAITQEAKIERAEINATGMGIGGYDWPFQHEKFSQAIEKLNLGGKVLLKNDVILGLLAGSSQGWGVCINAGTSFNCRGIREDGREGRVIGEGMMWGEGAGALEVVQKAIQQVGAAWTRRIGETTLSQALLSYYREKDLIELVGKLATRQVQIDPQFAPTVFEHARKGDRAAQEVVHWAGKQLGSLGIGVIRQLELEEAEFEIVLSGGMFKAGELILDPLIDTVHSIAPRARFVRSALPPVIGGVLLALQADGVREPQRFDRFKRNFMQWQQYQQDLRS